MLLQLIFALLFVNSRILGLSNDKNIAKTEQFGLKTMIELQSKHRGSIIEFNTDLLKKLNEIEHTKRDFNLFIIFNALDKETQCQYCG